MAGVYIAEDLRSVDFAIAPCIASTFLLLHADGGATCARLYKGVCLESQFHFNYYNSAFTQQSTTFKSNASSVRFTHFLHPTITSRGSSKATE